jgi:hypothetical protein
MQIKQAGKLSTGSKLLLPQTENGVKETRSAYAAKEQQNLNQPFLEMPRSLRGEKMGAHGNTSFKFKSEVRVKQHFKNSDTCVADVKFGFPSKDCH